MAYRAMKETIDKKVYGSLFRVYGSLTNQVIYKILTPSKRHYLRVNTYLITRGELIDMLKEKYPEYNIEPDPYIEDALYIVVKGPYKIPIVEKKIIVDKYAAESVMLGAPLYAPGVIKYSRFKAGEEVNIVAPNGRIVALAETIVDSSKLLYMKKGVVVKNIISTYKLPPIREMEEYKRGLIYPQGLPSIIVSHIVSPTPGESILDCCASPGGKTSHLIQLSQGLARIVSIDRSMKKIGEIIGTLKRLHLPRTNLFLVGDARYINIDIGGIVFDKIIIDPPCTGLGVRPKISIDVRGRDIENSKTYQKQFIKPAVQILRQNGLLVYSTCTLTFEENEEVSLYALRQGLISIEVDIPYADKVYIGDLIAYRFSPITYDMPGYYISVFKKKPS